MTSDFYSKWLEAGTAVLTSNGAAAVQRKAAMGIGQPGDDQVADAHDSVTFAVLLAWLSATPELP